MPNHSTNYLRLYGPVEVVDALIAAHFRPVDGDDTVLVLDFETVVPTPADIAATVSPTTICDTQADADDDNLNYTESTPEHLRRGKMTKAITRSEAARRVAEHGAINWYDFHNRHWGTKWNAYSAAHYAAMDAGGDEKVVQAVFDTAWCAPTPIFAALDERYPELEVTAITLHEGGEEPTVYGDGFENMSIRTTVEFY